jgi:hypothetical protein
MVAGGAVEQEIYEALEGGLVCQHIGPAVNAEGEEIRNIPVTVGPDAAQSAKASGRGVGWRCLGDAGWGHPAYRDVARERRAKRGVVGNAR